jgi:Tol biopolymer transport system component
MRALGPVCLLVAALSAATGAARGHETWLMPRSFRAAPLDPISAELTSGMAFPRPEHAIARERIAREEVRQRGESLAIESIEAGPESAVLRTPPSRAGIATIWVALHPKSLEMTDDKVDDYLDEIGASKETREAWAALKGKHPWRETYTKYAKTFIKVGNVTDNSWRGAIGAGLEIVPIDDPFELREGGTASFQMLQDGKPVRGQQVGMIVERVAGRVFQTSDVEGRVMFPIEHSGRVLVFAVNLRKHATEPVWDSDFTTLTFGVEPPAELQIGQLDGQGDIGSVRFGGSVSYDAGAESYTIRGGGANMWGAEDAFHFAWREAPFRLGGLRLESGMAFLDNEGHPHRKACLMFRESLDSDSPYVDVALHGDGLTSLQFRETKGGPTREIQANVGTSERFSLQKHGDEFFLYTAPPGGEMRFSGASVRARLKPPLLIGMGVCAHDNDALEAAEFARPVWTTGFAIGTGRAYSVLETMAIDSTDRRVVLVSPDRIEAPNWTRDGRSLIYNSGGRMHRISSDGGEPTLIDTGFATRCNNDHGVSPDGATLVISDESQADGQSRIYTLPIAGGTPKLITPNGPSYWHGWSPDGKTLVYCAERNGELDVYAIPAEGGEERRLTAAQGLDDGPDYSHDGKHIYFNSVRSGLMQIWRMDADGSNQQQVTDDELNNWFAHPSPDGRFLVFLSYEKDVEGHPADKDVMLRRMTLADGTIDVLAKFRGGQGTVNVPCWSPDGKRIAFVTYPAVPYGADQ